VRIWEFTGAVKENSGMKNHGAEIVTIVAACLLCLASRSMAGEPDALGAINAGAGAFSRIMIWWAKLYPVSPIEFTLLTILVIPVTGLILGIAADLVMKRIGIDLESRNLSE
jgi:hypothetical protein